VDSILAPGTICSQYFKSTSKFKRSEISTKFLCVKNLDILCANKVVSWKTIFFILYVKTQNLALKRLCVKHWFLIFFTQDTIVYKCRFLWNLGAYIQCRDVHVNFLLNWLFEIFLPMTGAYASNVSKWIFLLFNMFFFWNKRAHFIQNSMKYGYFFWQIWPLGKTILKSGP
jgi:hypothetical protein